MDKYGDRKKLYISQTQLDFVVVDYRLQYNLPRDLPALPHYVTDAHIGLAGSQIVQRLYDDGMENVSLCVLFAGII